MGYNFILSESEKREILNKHNSYKNFLNEQTVAPSIMDIQLKLIKLGFENLLGPTKADGKFGKFTCNAILSALTLLKQKQGTGSGNMENMPTIIRDCILPTDNSVSLDSFGTSFILQTNGTVSPENRQLFGMDGETPINESQYGFGTVRTLREYEQYAGILFSKRGVQQYTIDKQYPPNPYTFETEEEWLNSFSSIFKHCIDLSFSQVPETDYDFLI